MNLKEKTEYHETLESYFNKKQPDILFQELLEKLILFKPNKPIEFLIEELSESLHLFINIMVGNFSETEIMNLKFNLLGKFANQIDPNNEEVSSNIKNLKNKHLMEIECINCKSGFGEENDLGGMITKMKEKHKGKKPTTRILFVFNFLNTVEDIRKLSKQKINYDRICLFDPSDSERLQSLNLKNIQEYFKDLVPSIYHTEDASLLVEVIVSSSWHFDNLGYGENES